MRRSAGRWWCAVAAVLALGGTAAAAPCASDSPACHLAQGKALLASDPARASEALLASFKLDERTDTLTLYAQALALDRRYALALETWRRIIIFRDSELDAANEVARAARGRKRTAARTAAAKAQQQSEQAAAAIIELWTHVARVRVRHAVGLVVTRDGVELDPAQDVLVNAGRDELVFTRKDGQSARVTIELAAGANQTIDAPSSFAAPTIARAAEPSGVRAAEPSDRIAQRGAGRASPTERAAAPPTTRPVDVPPPRVVAQAQPAREPAASTPSPRSSSSAPRLALGLAAGAVVLEGIAGGLWYASSRDLERARDAGCSEDGRCPFGRAADLAERANDRARFAQWAAIGGGVLAAAGVTLYVLDRRATRERLTLRVGPSSTALVGRF